MTGGKATIPLIKSECWLKIQFSLIQYCSIGQGDMETFFVYPILKFGQLVQDLLSLFLSE